MAPPGFFGLPRFFGADFSSFAGSAGGCASCLLFDFFFPDLSSSKSTLLSLFSVSIVQAYGIFREHTSSIYREHVRALRRPCGSEPEPAKLLIQFPILLLDFSAVIWPRQSGGHLPACPVYLLRLSHRIPEASPQSVGFVGITVAGGQISMLRPPRECNHLHLRIFLRSFDLVQVNRGRLDCS